MREQAKCMGSEGVRHNAYLLCKYVLFLRMFDGAFDVNGSNEVREE